MARPRGGEPAAAPSVLDDLGAEVTGIVAPVSICMALVVVLVKTLNPDGAADSSSVAIATIAYHEKDSDSAGTKLGGALLNAVVFMAVIAGMTFVLFLLFKYRCYRVIHAYMGFAMLNIFFFFTGALSIQLLRVVGLHLDLPSLAVILFNFSVGGLLSLFVLPGPLLLKQAYTVWVGICVAFIFTHIPEWTSWVLLGVMALYDLAAVLLPGGPLKILVELAIERQQDLPALIYESRPTTRPYRRGMWQRRGGGGGTAAPRSSAEFAAGGGGGAAAVVVAAAASAVLGSGGAVQRRSSGAVPLAEGVEAEGAHGARPPGRAWLGSGGRGVPRPLGEGAEEDGAAAPVLRGSGGGSSSAAALAAAEDGDGSSPVPPPGPRAAELDGAAAAARARGGGAPHHPGAASDDADASDSELGLPDGIKLGLGDFIFYSMLVGRAAMYDMMTVFSSYIAVISGLGVTLLLLALTRRALPALPVSIALGVAFYFLTRLVMEPFRRGREISACDFSSGDIPSLPLRHPCVSWRAHARAARDRSRPGCAAPARLPQAPAPGPALPPCYSGSAVLIEPQITRASSGAGPFNAGATAAKTVAPRRRAAPAAASRPLIAPAPSPAAPVATAGRMPEQQPGAAAAPEPAAPPLLRGRFHYPDGSTYEGEYRLLGGPPPEPPAGKKGGAAAAKRRAGDDETAAPAEPPRPVRHGVGARAPARARARGACTPGATPRAARCATPGTLACGAYTYTGQWVDDEMHGQGCFSFANGAAYEGGWSHNAYSGGEWAGGVMHGAGTFTDAEGHEWAGQFYNGAGPGLTCTL
ncbi:Psn [Scenedesmus sp. PABB004]|nr:Psn [Scenedesmus sp. PABB004]